MLQAHFPRLRIGAEQRHLLGLGLMLSANEVPRIAGAFGLDTSTRANLMGAVHTAQCAVGTVRTVQTMIK